MLSRRRFFRYSVLCTGAISTGYVGYTSGSVTFQKALISILVEDLQGLRVNLCDLQAFAAQLTRTRYQKFHFTVVQLIYLHHLNPFKSIPLPFPRKYREVRAGIVGDFLLSTNFFYNRMDEQKAIIYSGVSYSPYNMPCANPFSGLFYKN